MSSELTLEQITTLTIAHSRMLKRSHYKNMIIAPNNEMLLIYFILYYYEQINKGTVGFSRWTFKYYEKINIPYFTETFRIFLTLL